MPTTPPVILVHGFWHGSWCWSLVAEALAERDIASVAVDLAGHGLRAASPTARWARPFDPGTFATEPSPLAGITATSSAVDLIAKIRRIGRGRPCVLVAHSMGGVTATAAAELAPDLIAELVYVTAFAPITRPTTEYIALPENAGELVAGQLRADPAQVGALRLDPADPSSHDVIGQTFYNDIEDPSAAIALLSTDGPIGVPAERISVTAERFGSVPHSYVVCERDNAIRPALQRLMIDEIDAVSLKPTAVSELDTSHSPFLSAPEHLADIIAVSASKI
jgi:pimeloyl-ACP methyl ester carboxylesterase